MYTLFYDYEFKTPLMREKWENFLENIDTEIKENYTGNILSILINFRKCFHVTPYALKHNINAENEEHRNFALYLTSRYAKENIEEIAIEFNTTVDKLRRIKENQALGERYNEKLKVFFEPLKFDYICAVKSKMVFEEALLSS